MAPTTPSDLDELRRQLALHKFALIALGAGVVLLLAALVAVVACYFRCRYRRYKHHLAHIVSDIRVLEQRLNNLDNPAKRDPGFSTALSLRDYSQLDLSYSTLGWNGSLKYNGSTVDSSKRTSSYYDLAPSGDWRAPLLAVSGVKLTKLTSVRRHDSTACFYCEFNGHSAYVFAEHLEDQNHAEVLQVCARHFHRLDLLAQRPADVDNSVGLWRTSGALPRMSELLLDKEFTAKSVVGAHGGCIANNDVKLTIGAGALQLSQEIQLSLCWRQDVALPQTVLSPVVCFEPPNLVFQTPVTLSLPHCMDNTADWNVVLVKADQADSVGSAYGAYGAYTSVSRGTQWVELTLEDYAERKVTDEGVQITLHRLFPMLVVCGSAKAPNVAANKLTRVVSLLPNSSRCRPTVHVVACYNGRNRKQSPTRTVLPVSRKSALAVEVLGTKYGHFAVDTNKLMDVGAQSFDCGLLLQDKIVVRLTESDKVLTTVTIKVPDVLSNSNNTRRTSDQHYVWRVVATRMAFSSAFIESLERDADPWKALLFKWMDERQGGVGQTAGGHEKFMSEAKYLSAVLKNQQRADLLQLMANVLGDVSTV